MKRIISNKKGFTLIELLIVISIIGILASLLMANFIGVRQRARDAQRKTDLRQIQAALELYRADVGTYPSFALVPGNKITNPLGETVYMQEIPSDPTGIDYCYESDGSTYSLAACLENTNDSQKVDSSPCALAGCGTRAYYVVRNP